MTYINDALSFYSELRSRFMKLLTEEGILGEQVVINTKSLTPEEAIGITKRKDFPIITGKDVMVQAECMGSWDRRLPTPLLLIAVRWRKYAPGPGKRPLQPRIVHSCPKCCHETLRQGGLHGPLPQ